MAILTSGASALTWMTGMSTIFPTSAEYRDDLPDAEGVVKPSWLLTIKWMVPPIQKENEMRERREKGKERTEEGEREERRGRNGGEGGERNVLYQ